MYHTLYVYYTNYTLYFYYVYYTLDLYHKSQVDYTLDFNCMY